MRSNWLISRFTAVFLAAGCGDDANVGPPQTEPGPAMSGDAPAPESPSHDSASHDPPASITSASLIVDANRSGALEPGDPTEVGNKNVWNEKTGAVFLANLDDDDANGKADAEDDVVNGAKDLLDLSPIKVSAWADAPAGAAGTLSVDAASSGLVRIFRVSGDPAVPASYKAEPDPTKIALSAADIKGGAEFAIEGRDLVSSTAPGAWTGIVQLTLTVTKTAADAKSAPQVVSTDAAKLRVAPLVLQWNTAPTTKIFHTEGQAATKLLHDGLQAAMLAAPTETLSAGSGSSTDVWAQDYFDVGYTTKPGKDGALYGMRIFIRSAQPDREAGKVVFSHFLGPDQGVIEKHGDVTKDSRHSYSMNSFGNWDVIPPYTKNGVSYPFGRNYFGAVPSKPDESPNAGFQDFYRAQKVQPELSVDTSWLLVGHVDEFSSWVKTKTARGWGLLIGSPRLARTMLTKLQSDGNGAARLFVGKTDLSMGKPISAAVQIDTVLLNTNLMAASQSAQMHIDANLMILKNEIGLADSEVTEIPFLIETNNGGAVAYQPGTVNLLYVDGKVVIPDPFGPIIGGADPFKTDLTTRLGALGLDVHFVDDWDTFHENDGEVHCGTNVARTISSKWWEMGR